MDRTYTLYMPGFDLRFAGRNCRRSKTTSSDALSQSVEVLCRIAKLFSLPLTLSVVPEGERDPKLIGSLKQFAAESNQFLRA
jgi:hypothetical protein